MQMADASSKDVEIDRNADRFSRRTMLAVVSAGALTGVTGALGANTAAAASFGAPFVEMCFPVGVLSLAQKAALIKSVTEVVNGAMKLPPDPARKVFVAILETPEGGFGANGQPVVVTPK
jgi:phenylpyruvate tautomerase PptA (4-oxalocrotonate tautomerase family)